MAGPAAADTTDGESELEPYIHERATLGDPEIRSVLPGGAEAAQKAPCVVESLAPTACAAVLGFAVGAGALRSPIGDRRPRPPPLRWYPWRRLSRYAAGLAAHLGSPVCCSAACRLPERQAMERRLQGGLQVRQGARPALAVAACVRWYWHARSPSSLVLRAHPGRISHGAHR